MAESQSNNIPIQSQNNDRDAVPTNFTPNTIESYNAVRESCNEGNFRYFSEILRDLTNPVYNSHVQPLIDRYIPKDLRKLVTGTTTLIYYASNDPYVHYKVQEVINQTASKLYGSYDWTKNSAARAIDKTVETIYDQYGFAKDKASQGITTAKEQIPWDKINQISTGVLEPIIASPSIGLPNLVNLYRRSSASTPPSTEGKL